LGIGVVLGAVLDCEPCLFGAFAIVNWGVGALDRRLDGRVGGLIELGLGHGVAALDRRLDGRVGGLIELGLGHGVAALDRRLDGRVGGLIELGLGHGVAALDRRLDGRVGGLTGLADEMHVGSGQTVCLEQLLDIRDEILQKLVLEV